MDKFIKLVVWGENWCDDVCNIQNSYGYSLDVLNQIDKQFKESDYDLSEYYESEITLEMKYIEAQIGDYPPPNVEVEAYWDWKVVKVERFKDDPNYTESEFKKQFEDIF